jgi:hypothetical protein
MHHLHTPTIGQHGTVVCKDSCGSCRVEPKTMGCKHESNGTITEGQNQALSIRRYIRVERLGKSVILWVMKNKESVVIRCN